MWVHYTLSEQQKVRQSREAKGSTVSKDMI